MKTNCIKNFLLLAFLSIFAFSCKNKPNKSVEASDEQLASLEQNIGDIFQLSNVIDSSGNPVKLDFSKSELTIIDFWFNTCPPCLYEMQQFEEILKGKEQKVSVASISINRFTLWKNTLQQHSGRFAFLSSSIPNWKHYNLKSKVDERLKNDINSDNVDQLVKQFNVAFYPAYFVVNKDGIIKSRPQSAVEFIRDLD